MDLFRVAAKPSVNCACVHGKPQCSEKSQADVGGGANSTEEGREWESNLRLSGCEVIKKNFWLGPVEDSELLVGADASNG